MRNTNQIPSDWLTLGEVRGQVKVGLKVLYRECATHRLRHARIGGRRGPIRVHRDWVTQWLEASATPVEVRR